MTLLPTSPAWRLDGIPSDQHWLIEGLWADQAVGIVGGEPKMRQILPGPGHGRLGRLGNPLPGQTPASTCSASATGCA